jgi:hypothetical protein
MNYLFYLKFHDSKKLKLNKKIFTLLKIIFPNASEFKLIHLFDFNSFNDDVPVCDL